MSVAELPAAAVEAKEAGNAHFKAGDHLKAAAAYTTAIKAAPSNHVLYSNRAQAPHPAPPCPTLPHPPYHTTACEASRPYVAPKDRYGPSPKANPKFKKDSGRDQVTFFRELQVQRRLVHLNR